MIKWYLLWYLSKVADKSQDSALNQRIFNVVEVHLVSIEVRVVGVHCLHCSWAMLLVAKNKVYPAMEVCTDIVTFQCLKPKQNYLIHRLYPLQMHYCFPILLETNSLQDFHHAFSSSSTTILSKSSWNTERDWTGLPQEREGQSSTCLTSETPGAISSETAQVGSTK